MGLWRGVWLSNSGPVSIRYPHVLTNVDLPSLDNAHLTVTAELRNGTNQPVKGTLKAYTLQKIAFKLAVRPGRYTISLVLRAVTNPGRVTTLASRPFAVAAPPAR